MSFLRVTNDRSTDRVNAFKVPRFYKTYRNVVPFVRSRYRDDNDVQTFSNDFAYSATTGSVTLIWPTHQKGDIAFIIIETLPDSAPAAPSGWTLIPNGNQTSSDCRGIVWYRVCESGNEPTPTIPAMPVVAGQHHTGAILVIGGVSKVSHTLPVAAYNVKTVSSSAYEFPSITTTALNSMVVMMVVHGVDTSTRNLNNPTSSQLTGITELIDTATTTNGGGGFGVFYGTAPNIGTVTIAGTGGWSYPYITYVIALEPSTALPSP